MKPVYKRGERVKINIVIILLILAPLKLYAVPYEQEIEKYSSQYGLDSDLVKAVIQAESSYRKNATSPAGAKGLMQIMPATWKEWTKKCGIQDPDVFNPDHNIHVGCAYLAWCIKHAGDIKRGLIAYNRGLTRGRRENWKVDWHYKRVMAAKNGEEKIIMWFLIAWSIVLIIGSYCIIIKNKKGESNNGISA